MYVRTNINGNVNRNNLEYGEPKSKHDCADRAIHRPPEDNEQRAKYLRSWNTHGTFQYLKNHFVFTDQTNTTDIK